MELNDAIEEFNKVAANLALLKKKWHEIEELLSYPADGNWDQNGKEHYEIKCLEFSDLLEEIPKIRDLEIQNVLLDYNEVSQWARDVNELGEADVFISFHSEIYSQGLEISRYEHSFKQERRKLIRNQVFNCISTIDKILNSLEVDIEEKNWNNYMDLELIASLTDKVHQIDNLLGDSVQRPSRWSDIERHLSWGQIQDLNDILLLDWPSIKPELQSSFQDCDPFHIDTKDIGDLVDKSHKVGKIGTSLNWASISYEDFERLCADLLESSPNWENVEWLTRTNASDRGRDITAFWVSQDSTRGTIRERTLIQCKHRPNKSVSPKDIETFQNLSLIHGNVDLYLIITSGKFSDQATQIAEKQNEGNSKPKVELWEHWKLEQLLASHPSLIKLYGLR